MEASSPLAAMQQPVLPSWAHNSMYTSHPHAMSGGFGPGAFNFRDLSMRRLKKPDYFSIKTVRGSSPTASLAADLSQNFHIDMSPQLPTPRRSLFTSNLFGTLDGRECVTTPPLPSSSPGPLNERMDISPLPHKQPFSFAHIEIHSPTPVPSPEEDIMRSSPPRQTFVEPSKPNGVERRKSVLLRPTLMRTKGYSTTAIPARKADALPAFRFGAGSQQASSLSLGECFQESPPQDRRPHSANNSSISLMGPPKPNRSSCSMIGKSLQNGSPIGSHTRRPSNPLMRPRKQFRRSLSMFEHPGDVMNSQKEESVVNSLHGVMEVDELHQPVLPHFFQEGSPDSIPRITRDTLLQVLDGHYAAQFDQTMVIDCRFEYEFNGGHINGAVNFNDKDEITSKLFETAQAGKMLLIFHCEYSAHRAPIMARHVRKQDRATNIEQYPKLTYPEVYLLDGGYSKFFTENRDRCFPQAYVEMDAVEHAYTCEREMGRLRQNRGKLGRSQTFAFGQGQFDDSPTAPHRSKTVGSTSNSGDLMMTGMSSPMLGDRGAARRMASY